MPLPTAVADFMAKGRGGRGQATILWDMAESTGGSVAKKRSDRPLAGVAVLLQVGLLSWVFVVGLGLQDGEFNGDRSGWLYVASLAQALVILVVAGALLWKRPAIAAALPLLSLYSS